MKKRQIAGLVLILTAVTAGFCWMFWTGVPLAPQSEALAAMESDLTVEVSQSQWWAFVPVQNAKSQGLIFFPGANIDPRSYAPLLKEIAGKGITCVLVPVASNLAVYAPEKAVDVFKAFPKVKTWTVGGHSLGGAIAGSFAQEHPQEVKALILLASWPPEQLDLSGSDLRVLSIYGEKDGISPREKVIASRPHLPVNTAWIEIKGGNHGQFGWYGNHPGDNFPEISREVQQRTVLAGIIGFLKTLD